MLLVSCDSAAVAVTGQAAETSAVPPSKPSEKRIFTWSQVQASALSVSTSIDGKNANAPALLVIHGKVYDISGSFLAWHPGGAVAFSQVGYDASGAFDAFHDQKTTAILAKYCVGELAPAEVAAAPNAAFLKDIAQLRADIKANGWDKANPFYYLYKIATNAALIGTSITLLALYGSTVIGVVAASFFLALFWQQSGWLAHDFLHNQVFKKRWHNELMGYFIGNVCQGFSVAWWKHKHCTHHAATNIHSMDPDIDTLPYLAWSEHALEGFAGMSDEQLAEALVKNQAILFFPILSFARFAWATQSLLWNTTSPKSRPFPTTSGLERVTIAIHYAWLFGAAFYFCPPLLAILWISLGQTLCGFMLASVFTLNHNGMPVYSVKDSLPMDFYEISIVTGRNVEPTHFNNWFTGGLNFQIEHHMFPFVPRHNLSKIAPTVVEISKRYNIPYHSTSFGSGMREV
eukprot:jgi/Hompol1/990/HPOL_004455-RA